jgi:mannan endo-1,4-beta-mannosidase
VTHQGSKQRYEPSKGRIGKVTALLSLAALTILTAVGSVFLHYRFHSATKTVEYVAMGSSFGAGPGDGDRAADSLGLCEQSDVNYPHLLARRYGLSLNDVSCSGATTEDVLKGGQWFQPSQLSAILPGTKLVTVTVGGNDVSYLGSLTAWSCTNDPSQVPPPVRALGMCRVPDQDKVDQAFRALPGQLREIIAEIHRRAPDAHILLIDYTTVLPDSGTCARLPLTSLQADRGRELARRLLEVTAQVARETDSGLLGASDITRGHDVCSGDPWVYGFQFPSHFLEFGPVPFHPTEKAMQAIADAAGQQLAPFLEANNVSKQIDWSGTEFVERQGTHLTLAGKPYRFGGMNIEWLGLEDYGPKGNVSPHVPSDFEVEDALSTAEEMGSRVVRSQTMGDTVGCPACLEPSPGVFNDDEFRHMDSVVVSAARHHIRLIVTLTGDCTICVKEGLPVNTGMNQYLKWFGDSEQAQFYSDPRIVAAFEKHIHALLDHRNVITGVAYKDDPTILARENCNLCSVESHIDKSGHFKSTIDDLQQRAATAWVGEIGRYVKSMDSKHLYLDNSGFYRGNPEALDVPSVDIVGYEYYPHWALATHLWVIRKLLDMDASLISQHGKVDVPVEIGWDRTDWFFESSLRKLVAGIEWNPLISGDGFWALQAHAPDHGWQPIPVDDRSWKAMLVGESGEWWAMYYTGSETRINGSKDMAARAQILRSHFYAMAEVPVPSHHPSPPPAITLAEHGVLAWRGSAGSVAYDIERGDTQNGPWQKICKRCVNDSQGTWTVPAPDAGWYRMTAYNLDGIPSSPAQPREMR